MLDKILEEMISKELVAKGIVDVDREDGMFTISTNKGIVGVKQKGDKWHVGYLLLDWDSAYDEIKDNQKDYIEVPSEQKNLPFDEALQTAMDYLSIILATGYNQNMNLS